MPKQESLPMEGPLDEEVNVYLGKLLNTLEHSPGIATTITVTATIKISTNSLPFSVELILG
jgi:hypothetical protein